MRDEPRCSSLTLPQPKGPTTKPLRTAPEAASLPKTESTGAAQPPQTTATQPAENAGAHPAPQQNAPTAIPAHADGLELVGRYEDSGYREPPFMVRRADGQMVQLPEILYRVCEAVDGSRDCAKIAEIAGEKIGRPLHEDDVRYLLDEKLKPLGVLAGQDAAPTAAMSPLLALKLRTKVVPAGAVRAVTTLFRPLFWPPVVIAVIAATAVMDWWLFAQHGIAQPARSTFTEPAMLLLLLGMVVVSAAFHEIGHATACRYGGAKPGVMGVGVYIAWPAFYTDVTDSYRLGRGGRLRTDLGGIYFNLIFMLAAFGLYAATGLEALLFVIVVMHIEIAHQLLPFLRLDGYYVVADLTGVPDLFMRIRPILGSLAFWRNKKDPAVEQLKPWVRFFVTAWVLTVVPILAFQLVLLIAHFPRIAGTSIDAISDRAAAISDGGVGDAIGNGLQVLLLALPLLGIGLLLFQFAKRLIAGSWRWSAGSAPKRIAVVAGLLAAGSLMVAAWMPRESYTPISPRERGTFADAVAGVTAVVQGESLPEANTRSVRSERASESGGAEPKPTTAGVPAAEPTSEEPVSSIEPTTEPAATPSQSTSPSPSASPSSSPTGEPSPTPSPEATAP